MMSRISMVRNTALQTRLGNSRAKIHRDVQDGLLPPPIRLGSRWSAWPDDEIDAIVRARIAGWTNDQLRGLVKDLVARRKNAAPMQDGIAGLGDDTTAPERPRPA
jgi:prophage regulatory protein